MNTIIEELKEHVDFNTKKNIFIQGGYFEGDSGIDQFSERTAERAIELADYFRSYNAEHNVTLGVLVSDLGMVCGTDVCTLSSNNDVGIQKLVDSFCEKYPAFSDHVKTEKHMKNRGLRKIKKILKRDLAKSDLLYSVEQSPSHKDWFHQSELDTDILLFQEKSESWIAKCPTIMGAYYLGCMKDIDSELDSIVIDFCSFSDRDKVQKGAEVALRGFSLGETLRSKSTSIFPILTNEYANKFVVTSVSSEDF
ncbi:hypothetical protein Q8W40_06965 [Vibrio penaeicida]|uniref:hypothetical protein n=1 Tax=Vibrio penaeicida TaxID=104609 RepID=UPI0027351AF0|nr:hypothetical protein [Vibrio penaeicida]MDP2571912.1 hypothetical protein [Vibrio penaeicida]